MCGIVGAIAERQIEAILIEGLKRLEYRGYDSAGVAILDQHTNDILRKRVHGKVAALEKALSDKPILGQTGIAHTRWATHGRPNEINAHPHTSQDEISVVHNGIIENYQELRKALIKQNYVFESETDTEVFAHLLHSNCATENDMVKALQKTAKQLKGAFAICVLSKKTPNHIYAIRCGSPMVIGLGVGENFIASDPLALLPVTQKFIYLDEGDIASISRTDIHIKNAKGETVKRQIHECTSAEDAATKGDFSHYMLKEIHDQPEAIAETLRYSSNLSTLLGPNTKAILSTVKRVQIVACGTSYNAGMVARYWMESIAKIPTQVEVASEFRYRDSIMEADTLFIAISQSGETADTLAATRHAKKLGCQHVLAICNVAESSLSRESDLLLITRSGKEVGVAATKTFTAQLTGLALLTLALSKENTDDLIHALELLPKLVKELLQLDQRIQEVSKQFIKKQHALFIARGEYYPIALEGALKLKEISYIHAEAYAAGELKHGPIALIDEEMPVVVIAPDNKLFEKLASNVQEIQARGGEVLVLSNAPADRFDNTVTHIAMPNMPDFIAPIAYTIPLQLLAYHIAVLKGTDVDQPRNLAKSVTVE
ncbi:MAG: glutamine--fructose-6-phosphate transaminase (isomerizing) [Gammaproteobacteria bacterium]|nr:glutamine--fructose-6-phosphate transaminase (isomerizing) [Gammaproteobacteria bacterium]